MKNLTFFFSFLMAMFLISCAEDGLSDVNLDSSGASSQGSYSKLIVLGDFLYGINENLLTTVNLSNPETPVVVDEQELLYNTESLLHHDGILYIGSKTRMYIYALNEQGIPELQSQTNHFLERNQPDNESGSAFRIRVNDPIAVTDRTAYVTLNSLIPERQGVNEMRIFDITDRESPILAGVIPMTQPKGLGVDESYLFVCDGPNGLLVFDIEDELNPIEIHHFPDHEVFDVVVRNGLLMVVGENRLYQYDYSDIDQMHLISTISL